MLPWRGRMKPLCPLVYLLVSLLVVVLSPKTPAPAVQSFTATAGSSIWVVKSYIYMKSYDIHAPPCASCCCISSLHHSNAATTPSTVAQGATQNASTTPSNLPTPSPGHQFDCCEIIYLYEVIYISCIIHLYDVISTHLSLSMLPAPPAYILPFTNFGF